MGIEDLLPFSDFRPWQKKAVVATKEFFEMEKGKRQKRLLLVSPTGSGKSYPQLYTLLKMRELGNACYMTCPSLDIIKSLLEKLGEKPEEMTRAKISVTAEKYGIYTPRKLANRIEIGEIFDIDSIIMDEGHEAIDTNRAPEMIFNAFPLVPVVGYTATPFRGTMSGTIQLRKDWPLHITLSTIKECVDNGWIKFPEVKIEPLINDDLVTLENGKFGVDSLHATNMEKINEVLDLLCSFFDSDGRLDMGTIAAISDSKTLIYLEEMCKLRGFSVRKIDADTKMSERNEIMRESKDLKTLILQIRVLERGVDAPWLRRLVDLAPKTSPVSFMQLYGRIMRPGGYNEVICCNRNVERFAYLYNGVLPPHVKVKAMEAFKGSSERFLRFFLQIKGIGRFKVLKAPLANGNTMPFYYLSNAGGSEEEGMHSKEYIFFVHPKTGEVFSATRDMALEYKKGTPWVKCEIPNKLEGFGISPLREAMSPAQAKWWYSSAKIWGLDRTKYEDIDMRVFGILPCLSQTRTKVK